MCEDLTENYKEAIGFIAYLLNCLNHTFSECNFELNEKFDNFFEIFMDLHYKIYFSELKIVSCNND